MLIFILVALSSIRMLIINAYSLNVDRTHGTMQERKYMAQLWAAYKLWFWITHSSFLIQKGGLAVRALCWDSGDWCWSPVLSETSFLIFGLKLFSLCLGSVSELWGSNCFPPWLLTSCGKGGLCLPVRTPAKWGCNFSPGMRSCKIIPNIILYLNNLMLQSTSERHLVCSCHLSYPGATGGAAQIA